MSEFDTRRGTHAVADEKLAGNDQEAVAPSGIADSERGWQLRDPMRMVRAQRLNAAAQIGRSMTAWRKPIAGGATSLPKIFLSPKKNKGDDDDKQKKGTPGNNTAQNKQFRDAVREIERQIGRKLQPDDEGRLH